MTPHIVCFGELLWDCLPSGKVAGGAPFNIVNRANKLGVRATVISSVGKDSLGDELLALAVAKGNDISFVQVHPNLPTSQVIIQVGANGEPHYNIVHPVAWDDVLITPEVVALVQSADAVIYSSLGLRDARSREALFSVLQYAKLKICDVNLREGHYSQETIMSMLDVADVLRMNETELQMVLKWLNISSATMEDQMKAIFDHYNYQTVIATLGGDGAVCYDGSVFYKEPVCKVDVLDTVGAGDGFLAGYTAKILQGERVEKALKFGTAIGSLTASKHGGTPEISNQEIQNLLSS